MATAELVDIATACSRRGLLCVLGVVVDRLDVYRTKGSSSCVTFTIKDSQFDAPSWQGGLKIKYFNDDESKLPEICLNDVVLLRDIRVTFYQNKATGVCSQNDHVPWAIFRSESDPNASPSITTGPVPFQLEPLERRFALALLNGIAADEQFAPPPPARRAHVSHQPSVEIQASAPAPKQGGLPFFLIQDLQTRRLGQLLGQVVKMIPYDTEKCILYITDYTENASLMDIRKEDEDQGTEGDNYGYLSRKKRDWPGPWGQLSIQVTLWEPHASFARENVKAGDLVLLTYVHIKPGRGDKIEAAVHEDKRYPNKIHIRVVSPGHDERARELMDRRKEYWNIHGKPSDDPKKTGKKKKNEQKKQEIRTEEGQKTLPAATSQTKKNPNIKSRNPEVPIRSIEYILSGETHVNNLPGGITYNLPFQNIYYRLLARVVDFFPPKLEDFAVQVPIKSIADYGKHDNGMTQRTEWQWRFCLLVEGTEPVASKQQLREQMKVFVSGAEGEYLLNLTATDLRRHPRRLSELREKLFILWGDLEEKKRDASLAKNEAWTPIQHSSLPFECCVREYGVRCAHPQDPDAMVLDGCHGEPCSEPDCFGWERRFAMFGTTIHDPQ